MKKKHRKQDTRFDREEFTRWCDEELAKPLVEQRGEKFILTGAGIVYVAGLLEEKGFFSALSGDMEGFQPNAIWAGIVSTHMMEAAYKYMRSMDKEKRTPEEEQELVLVCLFYCTAKAQVEAVLS